MTAAAIELTPCPACGWRFDPARSHDGRRKAHRKYCSVACRLEWYRRLRALRRKHAALIAMHELEDAGQLSLDPTPLPPIPELTHGNIS